MITKDTFTRILKTGLVTFSAVGLLAGNAFAAEKGAERLHRLTGIRASAGAEKVDSGDRLVMSCSRCKTVMTPTVAWSRGRAIPTMTAKHLCATCKSTIEAVGHGKAKTAVVKHACSECGDESLFCCATSRGAGPTKGMERN